MAREIAASARAQTMEFLPALAAACLAIAFMGLVALELLPQLGGALAAIALLVFGVWQVLFVVDRSVVLLDPKPLPTVDLEVLAQAYLNEQIIETFSNPLLVIRARDLNDTSDRKILRVNAQAREFLAISQPGGVLVGALRDPVVLDMVDRILASGGSGSCPLELSSGRDRIWLAHCSFLFESEKGDRLVALELRDETDMRRTEQARADFLANASHELRTPLASLSGFIETLRGHARNDPDAQERFLAIMDVQASRMSRLIDDLLSLSRIELNEHIAPSGRVDIGHVVLDVTDALAPLCVEKAVRIEFTNDHDAPIEVAGDRDQIVQVVQNLIENALKYSPSNAVVQISLGLGDFEAAQSKRAGEHIPLCLVQPTATLGARFAILTVSDQGKGIPREFLPRLTERFYRVEGQKSGDRSGTGLGLAIVKHILQRHGGGLLVQSAPQAGSSFLVLLPSA